MYARLGQWSSQKTQERNCYPIGFLRGEEMDGKKEMSIWLLLLSHCTRRCLSRTQGPGEPSLKLLVLTGIYLCGLVRFSSGLWKEGSWRSRDHWDQQVCSLKGVFFFSRYRGRRGSKPRRIGPLVADFLLHSYGTLGMLVNFSLIVFSAVCRG